MRRQCRNQKLSERSSEHSQRSVCFRRNVSDCWRRRDDARRRNGRVGEQRLSRLTLGGSNSFTGRRWRIEENCKDYRKYKFAELSQRTDYAVELLSLLAAALPFRSTMGLVVGGASSSAIVCSSQKSCVQRNRHVTQENRCGFAVAWPSASNA